MFLINNCRHYKFKARTGQEKNAQFKKENITEYLYQSNQENIIIQSATNFTQVTKMNLCRFFLQTLSQQVNDQSDFQIEEQRFRLRGSMLNLYVCGTVDLITS